MSVNFSILFSGDVLSASFDAACQRALDSGRVPVQYLDALSAQHGIVLGASPARLSRDVALLFQEEKAPLGRSADARIASAILADQLVFILETLAKTAKSATVPALPVWGGESRTRAAIESEKQARADARKTKKAGAGASEAGASASASASEASTSAGEFDASDALARIHALASAGQLTATQWAVIDSIVALRGAGVAPDKPAKPAKKRKAKTAA